MKKTLLTLAIMLLGLGAAKADVVKMTPTAISGNADPYTVTCTSDPASDVPAFTFAAIKNNSSTKPTYNASKKDLRIYAKGSFSITAPEGIKITNVVFTLSTQGQSRYTTITADNGTIATQAQGDTEVKWSGSASSVKFTAGDKATLTTTPTNAGQFCFTSFAITYETNDPSDTRGSADIAFPESSYTVNEGEEFTAPVPTKATTAALSYTSSNTAVATVDATTGAVTVVAPGSTEITAAAAENSEFKAGEASYILDVLKVVNSIAETMEVTDKTLKLRINYPLTVAFKNFNNNFACNGNDFIQIYGSQPDYKVGDVIPAGWVGCYDLYNGATPEILNSADMQAATENNGFTPAKVSEISAADVNKVLTLENVVFAEATPSKKENFSGTVGGNTVSFRNNYTLASVEAGTYNVTGVVTVYNNAPQFYVTAYEESLTNGIADIVADENAPVEYFNLQGIRVENPSNGLYIRRQGNKVTKVIVK
ncbi:MAG: Ig-like domain-containing protein [Duncaniella sp.]|uniref:Ig-like domain-containing protein n=1 Tax=Duncaniella sp. TaxID=2518496 RepID=UPI0023C30774|nr:Ig-like domain-containing protein [Duncaniella sp.]MDE5989899.1 Ig-like domain-containing protein [Duncaniella sp.]